MPPLAGRTQELGGHEAGVLVGHAGDEIQHPQIGDVQVILTARRMAAHFRAGVDNMVREAELEELKKDWEEQNRRIMAEFPNADDMPPKRGFSISVPFSAINPRKASS